MPNRYILASARITVPGQYDYTTLSRDEAVQWLRNGKFTCDIRYGKLTKILHDLTGICIFPNTDTGQSPTLEPGDEALVFSIARDEQFHYTSEMTREYIMQHHEFGLFRRLPDLPSLTQNTAHPIQSTSASMTKREEHRIEEGRYI